MPNLMNKKAIQQSMSTPRQWFNVQSEGRIGEVYIYDVIGMDWWGDGVDPQSFIEEIKALDVDTLNIHINSPGGYINEGKVIYNYIKRLQIETIAYIDGVAASTASWIPMACDKIICAENAEVMIHNPWGCVCGEATDLRKAADTLDIEKEAIIGIYQARTGLDREKLAQMMDEESWMLGNQALELGFVDEVEENARLAACVFDLNIFNVKPTNAERLQNATEKRNLEKSLRDAGYSKAEAKKLAGGPSDCDDQEELNQEHVDKIGAMLDQILNK